MKRFLSILLTLCVSIVLFAETFLSATAARSTDDYSLYEIQTIVDDFLSDNNYNITTNSPEFFEFTKNQLLGENPDKRLINHDKFDLIHSYLVEYYVEICDNLLLNEEKKDIAGYSSENTNYVISNSSLDKTLKEIKEDNISKMESNKGIRTIASYSFSRSAAASYARQYAISYNPIYKSYWPTDCRNFVSQCLHAGGLPMHGSTQAGVEESTTEWYHYYSGETASGSVVSVTTSFIRVVDLVSYLSNKTTVQNCTTVSQLYNACSTGDAFFLADATTLTPYHAMIISNANSSSTTYCGHTNDRKDSYVRNIPLDGDIFILCHFN